MRSLCEAIAGRSQVLRNGALPPHLLQRPPEDEVPAVRRQAPTGPRIPTPRGVHAVRGGDCGHSRPRAVGARSMKLRPIGLLAWFVVLALWYHHTAG